MNECCQKLIDEIENKIKQCDVVCEEDCGLGRECGYSIEDVEKLLEDLKKSVR